MQLADDSQSMVRKAAVFCMVELYIVMGEEKVKPKFALLNASKIRYAPIFKSSKLDLSTLFYISRLLNVYIAKSMSSNKGVSS